MSEEHVLNGTDDPLTNNPADAQATAGSPGAVLGPEVPLELLEERICTLAGHLAAGTCQFLQLIAQFDQRRGWASWDLPSCAAWLAWKCQLAPGTAREQVRVARALASLPVITQEFAAGRMSYAKARALTRIATPATEADLAQLCGPMTAGQCERFTAAHRNASDDQELDSWKTRRVRVHAGQDGSVFLSARLPAAQGAVVLQALRAAAGDCEHPHRRHPNPAEDTPATSPSADVTAETPDTAAADLGDDGIGVAGVPDGGGAAGQDRRACAASLADALVEMAGAYLSGKIATAGNPDIYQVIVHAGPEALLPPVTQPDVPAQTPDATAPAGAPAETPATQPDVPAGTPGPTPAPPAHRPNRRLPGHPAHPARCHLDDGPAIARAAAQAIACHATISWMLHDHQGNVLDVGRRHRRASPALRRAVRERDKGRCQYPGCNSRRTDIHHIIAWAKGGKTRLRDLISLCEAHHVIVHALGYQIAAPAGTFTFTRPNGQPLPTAPQLPGSDGNLAACHDADITTDTIIPDGLAGKFDLDIAIWAAYANARVDRERRQQQQQEQQEQEQDLHLAA